eukprot:gnl/MRDRNA2_/MRDRNA2_103900_c0_seq1.p1 gnl/MRDRNA2_/MRDRNA2_103900_c0~~gnl/MRDRNA2_/MRDRNA2_103900_c0_seq1.p1  ORF type:complete len:1132 (-),score=201.29 gnl/MRDRNA2_/MRDRNA2_103900_c0_seq1:6-3401(-)
MVEKADASREGWCSPLQRRRISFESSLNELKESDAHAQQQQEAIEVNVQARQNKDADMQVSCDTPAPKPELVTKSIVPETTMSSPPVWRVAFERPENVSRRCSTLNLASQRKVEPNEKRQVIDEEGESKVSSRKRCLSPVFERQLEPHLMKKARTGPQRAAARKKYYQYIKKMPSRRVAIWRSRIVDGEREVVYVSLGGEALQKSKGYNAAKADQRYLKSHGIGSFSAQNSAIENPRDLEPYASFCGDDARCLNYYCIPLVVQAEYQSLGLERLYDWQAECLQAPEVLSGRSLVYSAPTSGGKSLVAELLMMRRCLFQGLRALMILPYVSICDEKVEALQQIWGPCGLRIEAFTGSSKSCWHSGIDVAVCTIEKASSLLNRILEEKTLQRDLGTIIVDEMHLLGEPNRGYILELILLKIRLTVAKYGGHGIQIIGLSATLPNIETIGKWLGAHVHVSDHRPVPLHMFVKYGCKILGPTGDELGTLPAPRSKDSSHVVALVWDCVQNGHSVLVFCPTKSWCEKSAALIAEELGVLRAESEVEARKREARMQLMEELRQCPSGLCPVLAQTVQQGVAYHHAGLTVQERGILERGFRDQVLCCICATSTLAAGVNLPARRVIIRSLKVGTQQMDSTRFKQMAGRAGRAGLDTFGECFLMADSKRDLTLSKVLVDTQLTPVRSTLYASRLARAVLEACCLGLVEKESDLLGPFSSVVLRFHEDDCDRTVFNTDLKAAVQYLKTQKLLYVPDSPTTCVPVVNDDANESMTRAEGSNSGPATEPRGQASTDSSGSLEVHDYELRACPLGDGVVFSSLSPADGMRVFEDLQTARRGLRLDTDLHLVYLATPVAYGPDPNWSLFLEMYYRLPQRERAVADAVGVKDEFLTRASHWPPDRILSDAPSSDREREVTVHRRFWYALMLNELLQEVPLSRVSKHFDMPRGEMQGLQALGAVYCRMVAVMCERLRWLDLAAMLGSLHPRLNFGASAEILPLCQIPECYPARARALVSAGLDTVEALARAAISEVERILRRLHQFESFSKDNVLASQKERVIRRAALRIVQGAQTRLSEQVQEAHDEVDEVAAQLHKSEQNADVERQNQETDEAQEAAESLDSAGEESPITTSAGSSEDEKDNSR